jgi:2-polyprenyl-6-methoxyphenol hydroxylase-like FAD-dependent oxidoreductase
MDKAIDRSVQLLVIGAGPVGLTSGLCAARRGLHVEVIDQAFRGWGRGFAALLHPGSVRLFDELGLADRLRGNSHVVRGLVLHVDDAPPLRIALREPALAVPQARIEEALLGALRAEGVELRAPFQAATVQQQRSNVRVRVVRRELTDLGSPADFSEWRPLESSLVEADFVLGADGYDSRVRSALGIEAATLGNTEAFAMFEVGLGEEFGDDFHLAFSNGLASAVLPLAGRRARFGFQLSSGLDAEPGIERLETLLSERAPWFPRASLRQVDWSTVIHFERRLARRFGVGRVWLAGDAAHVTSPFGAHSMNAGLAEAHDFVEHMARCCAGTGDLDSLARYGSGREREWQKLCGYHVKYELLPNAPAWLGSLARRIAPALPVSGPDLHATLRTLGLGVA